MSRTTSTDARERQRALMPDPWLAVLGHVLHDHHDSFGPGNEIHRPAHGFDHETRDHPVARSPDSETSIPPRIARNMARSQTGTIERQVPQSAAIQTVGEEA